MTANRPELFFIGLTVLGFAVLWIGLSNLIAHISGWTDLATFYRLSGLFDGQYWRFQSAELRWKMRYNNSLTVGTNPAGLYLSVFFIFRFGHPNLFVPWADIFVTLNKRSFWSIYAEFRFRKVPMVPFRVNQRLAQRIKESAGGALTVEDLTARSEPERR